MPDTALNVAGREGGQLTLTADDLDDLRTRLTEPLLLAGDPGWDDAIRIWNGMVASTPAVVVQPTSPADVVAVLGFVREKGVAFSVKGGGHNIAGLSMVQDGLTMDLSDMRDVVVDTDARLVHVGPGCLLKDVDRATQAHGLAAVLGFVSETGVAGLTLGGGFGYLTRRFGYTVDDLEEVEIVTADGTVRIANRTEEPDLFWALRGGGGNFGVVTRFTLRVHEVGPTITGGPIFWSADRAAEVLAAYRHLTSSAPRELTAALTIRRAPPAPFLPVEWHGRPIIGVVVCHSGADPATDLKPIRDVGDPIVDLIVAKPYADQQSMLDATQPKGLHYYWKTEFLGELSEAFLEDFRTQALRVTSPQSQSILFHIAGALNEHPADDGAVGNRDAHYAGGFSGAWAPDVPADEHLAWVRSAWARIRPHSTGGNYVNFQVADDDSDRTASAYGDNLERLQQLKRRYDPDNLFRVNRNIAPAA